MPTLPGNPYFAMVDELFAGRTGTEWAANEPRTYERRFLVQVKDRNLAQVAVCQAPGIPLPYAFYQSGSGIEYDLAALMIKRSASQRDDADWQFWIVTCLYSTAGMPPGGMPDPGNQATGGGAGGSGSSDGAANNPTEEAFEYEWESEEAQVILQSDLDGFPFINSALQPFIPAPTFPVSYPVLVFTRNYLTWGLADALKWSYSVNSDTFLGAPPARVQSLPPKAKQVFRGNIIYWKVTFRLRFQTKLPDGSLRSWQPSLLDQGLCRLQNDGTKANFGKPIPILRGTNPITQPDLLDGTGQPVKPDEEGTRNPVFVPFRVYHEEVFADLLEE